MELTKTIKPGSCVVAYLQNPREKFWGRLVKISLAGVYIHGIELNAFDGLVQSVCAGDGAVGPSLNFFPMWRVERILLDERVGQVPSLEEEFRLRTGIGVQEIIL